MGVKELFVRLDSEEIGWWKAYDRINPIGDISEVLSRLCVLLASVNIPSVDWQDWHFRDVMQAPAEAEIQSGEETRRAFRTATSHLRDE